MKKIRIYDTLNLRRVLRIMLLFIPAGIASLQAQSPVLREYQVKAAFLYNFSQFVEWPETEFTGTNSSFVIGIAGADPFGNYLDELVSGEKILDHPIIVERYANIYGIEKCQILFVNTSYSKQTLDSLQKKSILTVSDASNFIDSGGIIRFFTHNGKIRFEINASAAKASNLNISSKLLRVAKVIDK